MELIGLDSLTFMGHVITSKTVFMSGTFVGLLLALALDRVLNRGRNQELDRLLDQEEVTEEEVMRLLEDKETTHKETSLRETNNKNYEKHM